MTQRTTLKVCRMSGLAWERSKLNAAIRDRQRKHKAVADLQARLKEVTNEILRLEVGHG